ncbi:MAG: EpsG family protein, partial [Clostridiales bacterium]|nr:EpsG family protein [Clostridiales bacterium]
MLFLSALVINLAYMKSARRYSSDPVLSFFLFFCLMYMDTNNGLRQMVAAAIVILAFPLLEKRRYFLFALFVAAAYQLHNTAAIWVLIAIAVVGKPMNIRTKFALLLGLVFLLVPGLVTGFLDSVTVDNQYNSYLDLKGGMRIARALVSGIIPGALAVIFYYKSKRNGVVLDRSDSMMLNIVIINTMFVLMGTYMQYWNRFAFYTMFSTYIMIPKLAEGVFGEYSFYRGGIRMGMTILYFLYFCYNIYANSGLPGASSDSLHNFYIEWWC